MDSQIVDANTEILKHDDNNTNAGDENTDTPDHMNAEEDVINTIASPLDTRTVTTLERQQTTVSNAISTLLLPCVASPIASRRRQQQQHPQKRRAFGVSTSSDLDMDTSIASPAVVLVPPVQNDIMTHTATESLWNDNDDDSDASLLSLDADEEIEPKLDASAGTWLSTEPRSTTTGSLTPSTLPSDLLPNTGTSTSTPIADATATAVTTPNSVSVPNTDDEHDDSMNDHEDAPTSPELFRNESTTATTSTSTSSSGDSHKEISHSQGNSEQLKETTEVAEEPDMEDILASTDALFEQVTDKATVTVKDILQSLAAEYSNVTFTKAMKATIRARLVELITAAAQKEEDDDDGEDDDENEDGVDNTTNVQSDVGDSDHSDTDESEADADTDPEPSDDEDFTKKSKKKSRYTKKSNKTKPVKSKKVRQLRPKKPSAASAKLSLRVHAEQRRKRRLEELRVRNEELLLHQNAIDRERAEQIAAKFATNTEELRQERLEQRIHLLQKLNDKRINACCNDTQPPSIKTERTTVTETANAVGNVEEINSDQVIVENNVQQPPSENLTIAKEEKENDNNLSENDSESDEDDDDEDELEIVGRPSPVKPTTAPSINTIKSYVPPTNGVLALLDMADANQLTKRHVSKKGMLSPGRNMDQRALLREKLKERQRSLGNRWLARELGYKTEEEHLEVCLAEEKVKRERIYQKEQERIKANERTAERMMNAIEEGEQEEPVGDANSMDGTDDEKNEGDNDDDEEMALARELESEQMEGDVNSENEYDPSDVKVNSMEATSNHSDFESENKGDESSVGFPVDGGEASDNQASTEVGSDEEVQQHDTSSSTTDKLGDAASCLQTERNQAPAQNEPDRTVEGEISTGSDLNDSPTKDGPLKSSADTETSIIESNRDASKPKGPRNKAWQAILQQDAEKAKKKKRSQLIEEEADEEEEEEVAGLEDFGFVVHKKKNGDDDDDVDLGEFDEDDLEHVVDDISDDEGDEQAGEKARKAMEAKEEKERHKEMLRRMRDGYDGRRGGIAGGNGGARGVHRFDQLVAADNREDAKLLGLLNDDEIDSDNEEEGAEKGADNEEDDEHVLLDKMLKARFLHRSTVEEEHFSDDEGDEDNIIEEGDGITDNIDEEEKEQERLAKRFAKRARMQRLIEVHGHEAEFSESKLIDEDTTLKLELQRMKNGLIRKQSDSTSNSWQVANSWSMSNTNQQSKKQKTTSNVTFATSLLSKGGSLAIALQANRKSNKARTSFVSKTGSAGSNTSLSSKASSSFQKCISFNHVVFHSSNSDSASRCQSVKGSNNSRPNNKLSNITNKGLAVKATDAKVASNQDSLFSKLSLQGNQRKRKL